MNRALAALTGAALLVVLLDVAGHPHAGPALAYAAAFAALAVAGPTWAAARGPRARAGYVAVQLVLGYLVFGAADAGLGATLLLIVLVLHAVRLLPLPAAVGVAVVVPFFHLGMPFPQVVREIASTAVVVGFAVVLGALEQREERGRAALAAANARLAAYAGQAEELATRAERSRLAREIHDGLGHHLTVVGMQVRAAQALLRADPDHAADLLAKADEQSGSALDAVRRSVAALREPWEDRPVPEAIGGLVAESVAAGTAATLTVLGPVRELAPEPARTVFRVTQEGLTNVRKHAPSAAARVVLDFSGPGVVRLTVEDDGGRAGPDAARPTGEGTGLVGVRERVAALGGTVVLGRSAAGGRTLVVEVPG